MPRAARSRTLPNPPRPPAGGSTPMARSTSPASTGSRSRSAAPAVVARSASISRNTSASGARATPARTAPPFPRLTGRRRTCAPAPWASTAVASVEPSSTTRTRSTAGSARERAHGGGDGVGPVLGRDDGDDGGHTSGTRVPGGRSGAPRSHHADLRRAQHGQHQRGTGPAPTTAARPTAATARGRPSQPIAVTTAQAAPAPTAVATAAPARAPATGTGRPRRCRSRRYSPQEPTVTAAPCTSPRATTRPRPSKRG